MSDKLKKYLRIFAITAFFLIFLVIPVCLYTVLRLGFPPVIGNLLAARNMTAYAAQAHPDWTPKSIWAGYDPGRDSYCLSFNDGTQLQSLEYSDKRIYDNARVEALRTELEIDRIFRVNNLLRPNEFETHWYVHWSAAAPEQPIVSVTIYITDSADSPLLTQSALKEEMADQLMEVYDLLAPAAPIHALSISRYRPAGPEEDAPQDRTTIQVELPEGKFLTREDVLSGTLTVK